MVIVSRQVNLPSSQIVLVQSMRCFVKLQEVLISISTRIEIAAHVYPKTSIQTIMSMTIVQ